MTRLLRYGYIIILSLLTYTSSAQSCYKLVWSDEFNGTSLNTSDWNYILGDGCPGLCGWGNNEFESYTNSENNISIGNGVLTITAIKENIGSSTFSSAKIDTKGKQEFTYGRMEARMKMPQGFGLWPAFWMLRHDNAWPMTGEIDIMEYRGDQTNKVDATLHYGSSWPNNQHDGDSYNIGVGTLYDGFHNYAIEWDANSIKWYIDDQLFKTETKSPNTLAPQSTNDAWPWGEDFYFILNLAVGGWYTGATDPDLVEVTKPTFEIDYVRVYELGTASPGNQPYGGNPATIPGTIEFENYDDACTAPYYDDDDVNNGGQYRSDGVDIEVTSDGTGDYNLGWTAANEFTEYTVDVATTDSYDFTFRVASGDVDGGSIMLEVDDVDVTGTIVVANTGDWQSWTNVSVNGINLTQGQHIIRLNVINGGVNLNYFTSTGNTLDCNGDFGGTAVLDNCGVCSGGNTSVTACTQVTSPNPEISNIILTPNTPNSTQPTTISADIIDDISIASATLNWGTSSGNLSNSISMSASGNNYSATIPSQSDGSTIFYAITAIDGDANSVISSEDSYTVTDVILFADYDVVDLTFNGFGGSNFNEVNNLYQTGINTSNKVGCTAQGIETWAGISSQALTKNIDFTATPIFKMKVYGPKIGDILVKFENSIDNNINYQLSARLNQTNTWTEITIDFSAVTSTELDRLVLFFDFGISATDTYYFDYITMSAQSGGVADCNGDLGGTAVLDNCGVCSGGNTSVTACTQIVPVSSITVQGTSGVSTITTGGGTLQMEATVLPANATDKTVTWSVTNGTGSATINASGLLTAVTSGTVTVKATANDGSTVNGTTVITISNLVTGLSNSALNDKFSIYPNPANEELNIESQGLKIESISIIDIKGNTVKVILSDDNIDVSDLAKGAYILQIKYDNNVINKHFVKE